MKKNFLKVIGSIVIIVGLGGFWGYNKYFKPDPVIQQELNSQFGADFFSSFDHIEDANNLGAINDNTQPNSDEAANGDQKSSDNELPSDLESIGNSSAKSSDPKITTPTTENENNALGQITEDKIALKYKPQFNYLQNVALSRLDTLYSAAIQEYLQRSKAGTLNRSELAQKYIQAGTMLEANVDSQFNSTLNAMQADLIANNLPTDIVNVTESEYKKAKSNKRSQLLAKVRK
ncbi:hypothetical protein [Desulfosporosinus sp. OT]|uniref:hypothetical protein n=1 Tax=Desulfosporosinus sp. OT TaxID=913865 RepID=UPI000307EDDE|nr:hypothetical protein [Desulfosporosinus sp. OT]